MAQQMMWDVIESVFRAQSSNGSIVTVDQDTMELAQKKAGKGVYESDWWVETLTNVLEHWGIKTKRWVDVATQLPRYHFSLGEPQPGADPSMPQQQPAPPTTSPLHSGPLGSGPLSSRLGANKLNTQDLDKK